MQTMKTLPLVACVFLAVAAVKADTVDYYLPTQTGYKTFQFRISDDSAVEVTGLGTAGTLTYDGSQFYSYVAFAASSSDAAKWWGAADIGAVQYPVLYQKGDLSRWHDAGYDGYNGTGPSAVTYWTGGFPGTPPDFTDFSSAVTSSGYGSVGHSSGQTFTNLAGLSSGVDGLSALAEHVMKFAGLWFVMAWGVWAYWMWLKRGAR